MTPEKLKMLEKRVMEASLENPTYYGERDHKGQRNGIGCQIWPNKAFYLGQWLEDKPS